MTRAEIRREQREQMKSNKTYMYNEKQVDAIIAAKKEELKLDIIQELFGAMMVSLRDEFGWFSSEKHGKKRIDRFIDRFNENMQFIEDGETKLQDYNEWCEENNIRYQVRKMTKGA